MKKFFQITVAALGCMIMLCGCMESPVKATQTKAIYTVVIDPGHGGIDHGSIGTNTGVFEDELNLLVSEKLAKRLTTTGIKVVMTRVNQSVYYDPESKDTKKRQDMKNRAETIAEADATLVVSIHMNKYPDHKIKGYKVFFQKGDSIGKEFAGYMARALSELSNGKPDYLSGDFFILKAADVPSVLVECGFLSNPEEELLLQDDEYQDKLADLICVGIQDYLDNEVGKRIQ